MKKTIKYLDSFIYLFLLFIIFTVLVKTIDVKTLYDYEVVVGFSKINKSFHDFTGTHFLLYNLTDWLSIPAFLFVVLFGLVGFVQLLKRKSLLKVDLNILALGIMFIFVLFIYVFFQFVVINRRPVLINGELEPSYPSSTTLLAISTLVSGVFQLNIYIKNLKVKNALNVICILYGLFLIIGRLLSGVHWLTDIIGSLIISFSMIYLYLFLNSLFNDLRARKNNSI